MSMFQKFDTNAPTKTHGAVDASLIDVVLPHVELVGSTANMVRSGGYGLVGWLARGKKETGNFSL